MYPRSNARSMCVPHRKLAMHGRTDGRTYVEQWSPSRAISPLVTRALAYGFPIDEYLARRAGGATA